MSQENVEVVLRLITAINEGDASRALLELHEDAEYFDHRASKHEKFQGHEAFRDHFSAIWRAAPDTNIVADVVAYPDDRVIVRQTVSATDPNGRRTQSVRWVTRTFRDRLAVWTFSTVRATPSRPPDCRSRQSLAGTRGTTRGTKLNAAEQTQLNSEHSSELRSPRLGLCTRYRTQEVAGSSPASSIAPRIAALDSFRRAPPVTWRLPLERALSRTLPRIAGY
jgi:ketosteroid isomerase-like protein